MTDDDREQLSERVVRLSERLAQVEQSAARLQRENDRLRRELGETKALAFDRIAPVADMLTRSGYFAHRGSARLERGVLGSTSEGALRLFVDDMERVRIFYNGDVEIDGANASWRELHGLLWSLTE